jgi:hypothetical protein
MSKNSKKKKFIKFMSGRGSKSLSLTVFLAEKTEITEPNYDTGYTLSSYYQHLQGKH